MVKIFFNYLREQRQNVIQVLGLGLLVLIMISTFLSVNFSNANIKNEYFNHISHNENFQKLNEDTIANTSFEKEYSGYKNNLGLWLDNMNYYNENDTININKLQAASFQISVVDRTKDIYRFSFAGSSDPIIKNNNLQVGADFAQTYHHNFVDFKLIVPNGYHEGAFDYDFCKNLIANYVYDPATSPINKVNFFILNNDALTAYNDQVLNKIPEALKIYTTNDIKLQAQLYDLIINGMLFQNIEWNQYNVINDSLMTGKSFAFIQYLPKNIINCPIIVDNSTNLTIKPLQNNEILIYQKFALDNNLKIGDKYNIANLTFTIRGFATSRDSAYLCNYFSGYTDPKNKTIAFVNATTMTKVNEKFQYFSSKHVNAFNPLHPEKGLNQWLYNILHQQKIYNNNYLMINNGVNYPLLASILVTDDYWWIPYNYSAITFINERVKLTHNVANVFLSLIFVVTNIIILMVIWKMIHHNHKLIGILKATGYKNWQLTTALVAAIIAPLLLFLVVGIGISVLIGHFFSTTYSITMALTSYSYYFNLNTALLVTFIPLLLLIIISFIMVYYFLSNKPLDLINSSTFKKHYHYRLSNRFRFFSQRMISSFSYRNKLVITTSARSFSKLIIISIVSIFSATLMLFSISASGLVNDMLGSQYGGINFNYLNNYRYDDEFKTNFIKNNQLTYNFQTTTQVTNGTSLINDLKDAINAIIKNPTNPDPVIRDVRNKYILGSQLKVFCDTVETPAIWSTLPTIFQDAWNSEISVINYLTNNNGQNSTDLLISFGDIPYQPTIELPFTSLPITDSYDLNFDNGDPSSYYYDASQQLFSDACFENAVTIKQNIFAIPKTTNAFINPHFVNNTLTNFSNLTINNILNSNSWLNKNFKTKLNNVKKALKITNQNAPNVTFIPIAASNAPAGTATTGNGNDLGKTIIYPYVNFDGENCYLVGIVYDGFSKFDNSVIMTPQNFLNNALSNKHNFVINNAKMSKFSNNELQHYLTFVNSNNDYTLDLTKIFNQTYLSSKKFCSSLSTILPVGNEKLALQNNQISLQIVIAVFAIFSFILSFTIMTVITNILVRDNWILINILRVMGYTNNEISYNFTIFVVPIILIFSLISIFITPLLTAILANQLVSFTSVPYQLIFRWWYFLIAFVTNIIIYLLAYIITWVMNLRRYKVRKFLE